MSLGVLQRCNVGTVAPPLTRATTVSRLALLRTPQSSHTRLFMSSTSSSANEYPIKVLNCSHQKKNILDWDDRLGLQQMWSHAEKGWKVADVDWKPTEFGVGLFAETDIAVDTVLRVGVIGRNLIQFRSVADINAFCSQHGKGDYDKRLHYVKDYLWGFHSVTDERGYITALSDGSTNRFFGMWIPGNGLNHCNTPNTVYRKTAVGIDLVALTDIKAGDEIYDDYRRHGSAPGFLKEFAAMHNVTLNFADCNDFVDISTRDE